MIKKLTPREKTACRFLLEGLTLSETAKQMNIRYPTVNTYQTAIYKKLSVNSRAELIIKYRNTELMR
ncbi:MAG: helix-turn-helix transcriptional regulator [Oscillospiraceae bacterium]|nr:helix-turn-helix transcriptional regulator [Oscillospiraceae bacterium]